jgi:ubiquinone/menaquinone biosynthesis C-methylase UbiE
VSESTFQLRAASAAAEYERVIVGQVLMPFTSELVDLLGLRPGERVLDVACGTGAVARLAADRVGSRGRVVGLDVDADMLAVARVVAAHPVTEWHEASATAMPLPDAAFDVVTCQQGLQFMTDRPQALGEMRRVLVPGGRLGLACWCSIEQNPGNRAIEQALTRIVGPEAGRLPNFVLGEREELRRLVREAGFREVLIRTSFHVQRHASAEDFVQIPAATHAARFGWSDAQRTAFVTDAVAALRAYEDDLGLTFPLATQLVTAWV